MEILLLGLFSVVRLHSGLSRRGGLDATMIDGTVAGGSQNAESFLLANGVNYVNHCDHVVYCSQVVQVSLVTSP